LEAVVDIDIDGDREYGVLIPKDAAESMMNYCKLATVLEIQFMMIFGYLNIPLKPLRWDG
jgi:hypothetical protein